MNLYELTTDLRQSVSLIEDIIENTQIPDAERDALIPKMLEDMDQTVKSIDDKLIACKNMKISWESDIEAIDREIARLKQMKQVRLNSINWINRYVKDCLIGIGGKFKTSLFSVRLQKSPPSVIVQDQAKLPSKRKMPDIWKTPPPSPILSAIRKRIEAGENVPGAELIKDKECVRWE